MTQNAANFGAYVGRVVTALANIDANQDKTIQLVEVFNVLQLVAVQTFLNFSTFDDAIREFRELGSEARQAAIAELRKTFDLRDDILEFLLEDTLSFLEEGASLITRWRRSLAPPSPSA